MRYRDIRPSMSEADNGAMKRYQYAQQQADIKANTKAGIARAEKKDADSWKNSVMNPDRYTPDQARQMGLINDKEYRQRMADPQAQALQGVYPELFLTPAGAARGVAGAVAKDAVGSAVARTAGNAARSEIVPAASNVVKNVASRDVVPAGGNVTKVVNPELKTINGPQQLTGPAANTTKQIGRNDPNVIDVTAKDITNRQALSAPNLGPDLSSSISKVPATTWKDYIAPTTAAVAAHGAVGGALYAANQSGKKDSEPVTAPPSAAPASKFMGGQPGYDEVGNAISAVKPAAAPATPVAAPVTPVAAKPPKPEYQGSPAAQELAKLNGIDNVNSIKAGQTINLGGDKGSIQVKPGQTLDKIAAQASTNAPALVPTPDNNFSANVSKNKADAAASTPAWAKPVNNPTGPADNKLDIPDPLDNLPDIKALAGIKSTAPEPAAPPAAPEPAAPPAATPAATPADKIDQVSQKVPDAKADDNTSKRDFIKSIAPGALAENPQSKKIPRFSFLSGL